MARSEPAPLLVAPTQLRARLGEAMNVLNGVAEQFPRALSLAAGRPALEYASLTGLDEAVSRYLASTGHAAAPYQYGPTPGLIGELIAAALQQDDDVSVDRSRVLVTAGAQEAMFLALSCVLRPERDVLLVPDPSYVGITGAAARLGLTIAPVPAARLDALHLAPILDAIEAGGRRPAALYLVPDYPNPSGPTLGEEQRRELIALARARGLLLLEDSPYRVFSYERRPPPSLLALGPDVVMHLGSLAKVMSPGLRLGYLIWPGASESAWLDLIQKKSFVSLNTAPLAQAIAGGMLLAQERPSFRALAATARAGYRARRDALGAALDARLGDWPGVSWQLPGGGFFVTMELNFEFDTDRMRRWAARHHVVVCPMTLFSPTGGSRRRARLAFANLEPEQLVEASSRLRSALEELS